jgi:hypothetical protein
MWCAKCQSEVAVEARPNSQRLHCATCGTEITPRLNQPTQLAVPKASQTPPQSQSATKAPPPGRDPQELLARWAGNQMFDPYGPIITTGAKPQAASSAAPRLEGPKVVAQEPQKHPSETAPVATPKPQSPPEITQVRPPVVAAPKSVPAPAESSDNSAKVRIDPAFAEGWSDVPAPHSSASTNDVDPQPAKFANQAPTQTRRFDPPAPLRRPHFDPARMQLPAAQSFKLAATMGQVLAYIGAATLTGGAALVLWGYLGGPSNLAPTGWFTTTVGQMLLFMGVVTLVSAGMEQTTAEVSRRVDTIGDQLGRLELAAAHAASATLDVALEAQLRAEIAELRTKLSERAK